MQISIRTGVVQVIQSSFESLQNYRAEKRNRKVTGCGDEARRCRSFCVSPKRAICSSARRPQLLRVHDTLYASGMSSQDVLWQLPL